MITLVSLRVHVNELGSIQRGFGFADPGGW
jgi:hypothetical protein